VVGSFRFGNTPRIIFGVGVFPELSEIINSYGKTVLIITGSKSFKASNRFEMLINALKEKSMTFYTAEVSGEPSPELVDTIVNNYRDRNIEVVVSIGGGSVLDTGKAVSAMLSLEEPVINYLEGVGPGKKHCGQKVPFIAVPTTSGTGSEATKNAVLSKVGPDGFKKSLRHDNFVPDIAFLDPELTISCPPEVTAASGLDAFTQLMGSYLSNRATPLTDALAIDALPYIRDCLIPAATNAPEDINLRTGLAYASLISGINLANAGLGIVHGLASAIGGLFDIPHGVVCGTLVGEAVRKNIQLLLKLGGSNNIYLKKYARVGALLSKGNLIIADNQIEFYCNHLVKTINEWLEILKIPPLGHYGITEKDLTKIAEKTGNKNNPIKLDREEIVDLLSSRL